MLKPISKQAEESQRKAKELFEKNRQREQDLLKERAKATAAVAEKTSRLKALRLAKEAADRAELAAAPPVKEKRAARAKKPAAASADTGAES
ncbi:MAG: hypothetical protein JNL25_16215 [Rhodospirillaceae bacterium]|nr:hypothetical protein [Rhodospirillaceae bacterium]